MEDIKKFGWHYQMPFNHVDNYAAKVQAAVVDMTDKLIVKAITEEAAAAGYTDLYLMDKKFVIDAIREKYDRASVRPLDLAELNQMRGEPVWVQYNLSPRTGQWGIVASVMVHDGILVLATPSGERIYRAYGKDCEAYGQKPKEAYR